MRQKKGGDYWRALKAMPLPLGVLQIEIDQVPGYANFIADFRSPINALCGPNGVGKTTLMALLGAATKAIPVESVPAHLDQGTITIRFEYEGLHTSCLDLASRTVSGHQPDARLIQPSEEVARHLQQLRQENVHELVESVEAAPSDNDHLKQLGRVLGIGYTQVETYEFSDLVAPDDITPFFVVERENVRYDSRTMGLGELTAMHTIWRLRRETADLFILEEFENFLAPFCTERLLDEIAVYTVRNRATFVLSSHSSVVLERLTRSSMHILSGGLLSASLNPVTSEAQIQDILGTRASITLIAWVDDLASSRFLAEILAFVGDVNPRTVEIVPVGGEGNIRQLVEKTQGRLRQVLCVGVLDGDADIDNFPDMPVAVLPGEGAPEAVWRDSAVDRPHQLAEVLAVPESDVLRILELASTLDPHDWLRSLATQLNSEVGSVSRALIRTWLSIDTNQSEATSFVRSLLVAARESLHPQASTHRLLE